MRTHAPDTYQLREGGSQLRVKLHGSCAQLRAGGKLAGELLDQEHRHARHRLHPAAPLLQQVHAERQKLPAVVRRQPRQDVPQRVRLDRHDHTAQVLQRRALPKQGVHDLGRGTALRLSLDLRHRKINRLDQILRALHVDGRALSGHAHLRVRLVQSRKGLAGGRLLVRLLRCLALGLLLREEKLLRAHPRTHGAVRAVRDEHTTLLRQLAAPHGAVVPAEGLDVGEVVGVPALDVAVLACAGAGRVEVRAVACLFIYLFIDLFI